MSGVINAAGSKSGVIGQTELDYEEGTFTPVLTWASGGSCNGNGQYVKIGSVVTIRCHFGDMGTSGASSGAITKSGLPFSSDEHYGMSFTQIYRIDLIPADYFYCYVTGTSFNFRFIDDDGIGHDATETNFNYSSATIGFAGSYTSGSAV